MFTMRTTKPSNNKYYQTIDTGGWNDAITGYPTDKGANVLSNCVGFASARFAEIQGKGFIKYQLTCNAENFIERAQRMGLKISKVPTLGGIMVWQKGSTLSSGDGVGHVAVVEKIIDSNTIYTSESSYGGTAFFNSTRTNSNGRWGAGSAYKFRGCIVNPAVDEEDLPVTLDELNKLIDERAIAIAEKYIKLMTPAIAEDVIDSDEETRRKRGVSSWAEESWNKAKKAKITDGTMPQDFATREQIVTMLDRAGVIK